jgi:hypothetical protein
VSLDRGGGRSAAASLVRAQVDDHARVGATLQTKIIERWRRKQYLAHDSHCRHDRHHAATGCL